MFLIYPTVFLPQSFLHPYLCFVSRQYPNVDPTFFQQSALSFQQLLKDGQRLVNHIATSKEFAEKIMDAAQKSKTSEVKELIQSIGITSVNNVSYNPDGITIQMIGEAGGIDCCHLTMLIRWR